MVLDAAMTDRLLGAWAVDPIEPNDQYTKSGLVAGARGEWLFDNDAIGRAIVESILAGAIGPNGLRWSSLYQRTDDEQVTDAEQAVRMKCQRSVSRASRGTRFDASGTMNRVDMSKVTLAHALMYGDTWSIRQWMPARPGRQVQATCWRVIHSSRVCNPSFGADTDRMVSGIELDDNGTPVAIHVLRHHRNIQRLGANQFKWTRVPWYDAEGWPNVTHLTLHRHPDQLRSASWFAAVIPLLRMFGSTLTAKVVADRLKASMGLIVECDDPEGAANADRNGAVLTGTTKIVPGKVYYVRKGTVFKELNFQYNGSDFGSWADVLLQLVCAAMRVPYEFVIQRLTKTNMAASRVALMQAYDTFANIQQWMTAYVEDPWNNSILVEDLARGALSLDSEDEVEALDRLLVGHYMGPPRHMPDPLKEAQAAKLWHDGLGRDLSGIYANAGIDLQKSAPQRQQDDRLLERHGIELASEAGAQQAAGDGEPGNGDGEGDGGGDEPATGKPKDGTKATGDGVAA
jgi:capsid protein